jgi:hypothetical protein
MVEMAWLITISACIVLAARWLGGLVARKVPRLWQWVPYSALAFVGVNLWIALAAGTCLFWCAFWNGKGTTDNLTQFHIKLLLMDENRAPTKVVLGGSSQVHAQIDHRLLNQRLGSNIFSTELHFPGNRGYDFLSLNRALAGHKLDIVVCYLSELNFFQAGFAPGFSLFFGWRDVPDFLSLGGKPQWLARPFAYALLGDVLPIFWLRDPMVQRFVGNGILELRKRATGPPPDIRQQIRAMVAVYHATPASDFHFRAFERFITKCREQHRIAVLCCGQMNPILGKQLDPTLRPQLLSFLHQLAAKYDNVVLLEEEALPAQAAEDYEDLTHVNGAAQARFTEAIARNLQRLASRRTGL